MRRSVFTFLTANLVILFTAVVACAQQSATRHPFTFEDMMALRRVADPVISPDGRWVLFSATDVNLEENSKKPHLWLAPIASGLAPMAGGGEAKQISNGAAGEERGRFSPDGKRLLFISARDGGSQIWIQDFDAANGALSGDARRVTSLSGEADAASWAADGQNIVFISRVYPDCKVNDDACNRARDDEEAKSKVKARIFERLMIRHWNRYADGKRSHLFAIAVPSAAGGSQENGSGLAPRDLTPGDHDVPPFNLGGQDFFAISPDGKEVAYTSNVEKDEATSTNNDIFIVPLAGGEAKKISASPGSDSNPIYSPDGKFIAWRMQQRNGYESDRFQLVVFERGTGKLRNLTAKFDRWVEGFTWAPDSQHIYFAAVDKGEQPIFRVSLSGGEVKQVLGGDNDDLQFTADGKTLVFTRQSIEAPAAIFKADLDKEKLGEPVALEHLNREVFARAQTSPLEPFWFTAADKTRVQGFLVKPPGFDAAKKYPVKFLIHGGPQSYWGDSWTYRWNAQLFAAGGYVVVMINPRGSVGYGQKFTEEISGDWGGRAYTDLMHGLDHAEAMYPFLDRTRVCAMGASFGGYMVNWIITHKARFQCAVSHDGAFNLESHWGTTEELWFPEFEFKGTPWAQRAMYQRWSPHMYAQNIKTPTLVVHGQLDYRLDVSEGLQFFSTLQRLNVPSKLLYFPDEGHWVLKPQNSRLWYKTVNQWVDRYLKPEAAGK